MDIGTDGRLKNRIYHDKPDALGFPVVNYSFLSTDLLSVPSYGFQTSELIGNACLFTFYGKCLQSMHLAQKLLN